MAFMLIQRLVPNRKSILPELLAKATKIPVLEALDSTVVTVQGMFLEFVLSGDLRKRNMRIAGRSKENRVLVQMDCGCRVRTNRRSTVLNSFGSEEAGVKYF
jgi:hypothetical protein